MLGDSLKIVNNILSIKDIAAFTPQLHLLVWSIAILLLSVFIKDKLKRMHISFYLSIIGILFSIWSYIKLVRVESIYTGGGITFFNGLFKLDGITMFFYGIFLITGLLTVFLSKKFLDEESYFESEYYALLLLSMMAMMCMAGSNDLIGIYISLEFMAISIYVLVGYFKRQLRSTEGAIKYFILGAFSSGLLLFGMSIIYGITGTTGLDVIFKKIAASNLVYSEPLLILSMFLILAGMGFKVAAVPFHMWCPDAYEGAPTPITGFMSVAPKAAGFAIFLRLFMSLFKPITFQYVSILALLSIVTMTVGNIIAVKQTNIKRLLAYSSISHAGFVLMGLLARNEFAVKSIGMYLLCYLFMNIGAFSIVIVMRRKNIVGEELDDYKGLIHTHPVIASFMTVFLLSLAGIPPTAGFVAKYFVFSAVIKEFLRTNDRLLLYVAIIGAINAVVALYYYFRIVKRMFMGDPTKESEEKVAINLFSGATLGITFFFTIFIGIYAEPFIRFANLMGKSLKALF